MTFSTLVKQCLLLACLIVVSSCGSSGGANEPISSGPIIPPASPPPPPPPPPESSPIPAGGTALLSPSQALAPTLYANAGDITIQVVSAEHGEFNQALNIEIRRPQGEFWQGQAVFPLNAAVSTNDVLLIHVFLRTTATQYETGAGFATVFMEGPGPDYEKYVVREISSDSEWQEYFIPVKVGQSFAPGQLQLKLGLGSGDKAQTIQIGGIEVISYGQTRSLASLPKTALSYGGREADASWRAAADARIEQYRKGELHLMVKEANGQAIKDANLQINFKRHAYHFGSVIHAQRLLEQSTNGDNYRQVLLDYFNQSGTENDLKWGAWIGEWGEQFNQQQTIEALTWLQEHNYYTRGHVMVWPSKRNLPQSVQGYLPTDPAAANPAVKQVVLDHIADIGQATQAVVNEWDVLNEPYDNHYLMDAFGNQVMLDWFAQARNTLPSHGLFINDYAILSGGGRNSAHQQHYQDTIQYLIDNQAPITGIGLQSHFSEILTDIDRLYLLLERYHQAFPELAIRATEFDINTLDESLQADYTRDFLTLFFSHPATIGVQLWGFWEGQIWLPQGAMFRQNWQAKPNAEAWQTLIYKTWWNNFAGVSDATGKYAVRGFYGDYQIQVSVGNRTKTFNITHGKDTDSAFTLVMD
jgi:endo-1,4-beta-xylanase